MNQSMLISKAGYKKLVAARSRDHHYGFHPAPGNCPHTGDDRTMNV